MGLHLPSRLPLKTSITYRYKWRVANCAEKHSFLCTARKPNCPPGFTFEYSISYSLGVRSMSCFRITEIGGRPDLTGTIDAQGNAESYMYY